MISLKLYDRRTRQVQPPLIPPNEGRGSDKVCLRRACAVDNEVLQPTWELSTKELESLVWTARFRNASALPTTAGLLVYTLVAAWTGPQRQVSGARRAHR